MVAWTTDKAWSDRFIPEIKRIVGEHLIAVPPAEEDMLRNTDLLSLALPGQVRIACRVRKYAYLDLYPDEFTLRCSRPSGARTEIEKLLEGWGDYLFYGFAGADATELAAWLLADLSVFRRWVTWYPSQHGAWPGELRCNRDGSSQFVSFKIDDVFPEFVVARKKADKPASAGYRVGAF